MSLTHSFNRKKRYTLFFTLISLMLKATVDTNNMLGQVETLNIVPSIRLYDLQILGLQITIIKSLS
jgi:hypothetical protein